MINKIVDFLRWSEKYTKTDMLYLAKGGFWLTLGQFFATGSSLILSVAFANFLPQEVFGTYKYILSIAGLASIATLPGVWTAVVQAVSKGFEGSLKLAIKTRMSWGAVGSLLSTLVSIYYLHAGNTKLGISVLIIAIFLPFTEPFNTYDAYLYGKKDFKKSTKYFAISQVVSSLVMLATLFLSDNLYIILLAYFLPWTLLRLIYARITLNKLQPNAVEDSDIIPYGKHLTAMSILNTIALNIDKIIVFHFLGAIDLAIYSFAIAIPEQIKATLKSIQPLAIPKFSQSSLESIRASLYGKMTRFVILITGIVIIYIIVAPMIYGILFPKYLDAIRYSQLFAISLVTAATSLPIAVLTAHKKIRGLYVFNISNSIIQIILFLVLTPLYGLLGAILSRIVARFLSFFVLVFLMKKLS